MINFISEPNIASLQAFFQSLPPWVWVLFIPLSLWLLVWKGLALWHAARHNSRGWFIVLLIVNTLSILELVYLFGIVKIQHGKKS